MANFNAHAQSFRGARDLAFCLKVPLDTACIGDKYQIPLTWPILFV